MIQYIKLIEDLSKAVLVALKCNCRIYIIFESKLDRIYFSSVGKFKRCKGHDHPVKGDIFENLIRKCLSGKMFNSNLIDSGYLPESHRTHGIEQNIVKYLNDPKINASVMTTMMTTDNQLHELAELFDKMDGDND